MTLESRTASSEATFGRRVLLLVIDGLGVGAMDDHATEDVEANTLRHVDDVAGPLCLSNLAAIGLGNLTEVHGVPAVQRPTGAFGRCALGYPGADTYLGHQKLMGGELDSIRLHLLEDIRSDVVEALAAAGYSCSYLVPGLAPILVDGCVVVADNVEAQAGLNINVTGSQDEISFEDLASIGAVVRDAVQVPRVIVVGGRRFDRKVMKQHLRTLRNGQVGVDTPEMGVYDDDFQVSHLGIDLRTDQQLPTRAIDAGHEVALIGKAADVVRCEGAFRNNVIATSGVVDSSLDHLRTMESGLIVANVQETDIAGHEEKPARYAEVLKALDQRLPEIIDGLRPDDMLLVTGDHGNDPTIGHSQHTREYVPALVAGPQIRPVDLGVRSSLADIGATAAECLNVLPLGSGSSFFRDVSCSST